VYRPDIRTCSNSAAETVKCMAIRLGQRRVSFAILRRQIARMAENIMIPRPISLAIFNAYFGLPVPYSVLCAMWAAAAMRRWRVSGDSSSAWSCLLLTVIFGGGTAAGRFVQVRGLLRRRGRPPSPAPIATNAACHNRYHHRDRRCTRGGRKGLGF
jgi:hypothetical protein